MTTIAAFKGFYPNKARVKEIIAPPYDVVNVEQARAWAEHKPLNMLHVTRPEIDLADDIAFDDDAVYDQGQAALAMLFAAGGMLESQESALAIYQMQAGDLVQTGLVCLVSTKDYLANKVKIHETTRPKKQADRVRHLLAHNGQVSPVLLSFEDNQNIEQLMQQWISQHAADYEVEYQAVQHRLWRVEEADWCQQMITAFDHLPHIYVADGHHRTASATDVAKEFPYDASKQWMLSVLFPAHELQILGYHRVITDLNDQSPEQFLEKLQTNFTVQQGYHELAHAYQYGLYLNQSWYMIEHKQHQSFNLQENLPVEVLSKNILEPILAIEDQRTSPRVDFIGGHHAKEKLEQAVANDNYQLAIQLYPTSMQQLMACADRAQDLPPKSTWFEPKLIDGLFGYLY